MFQSIALTKYLGYDEKTMLHSYEYELTDSDFGCVDVGVPVAIVGTGVVGVAAVIQEYSKRDINVAKNLILYFQWCEKKYNWLIADQIEWAEKYELLFTPQIKADLQKYLILL